MISKLFVTNKKLTLVIFLFVITGGVLAICSKCSFLYPINDWSDSNIYFTIGKGIVNGKVLYADLMDQKGPLIFFIYAIGYLISNTTLVGVYILEVISFSIFLFFCMRFSYKILKNDTVLYFIVPIIACGILSSKAFGLGGSAEEFCLPFLAYSLYSVLGALYEKRMLTTKEAITNGICVACILWIKLNLLMFYIGLILFVIAWYFYEKKAQQLIRLILFFLLGFCVVTIVILMYFIFTNSLYDFYIAYIYNNLFLYSADMTLSQHFNYIIGSGLDLFIMYMTFSVFIVIGFICMLIKSKKAFMCMSLGFLGLLVGVYLSGRRWDYYALVFSIFMTPGLISLLTYVRKISNNLKYINKYLICLSLIVECCLMLGLSYKLSENVYLMHYEKKDVPMLSFSQEIKKIKDADLICYDCMDRGFYVANNLVPNCKYFFVMNMDVSEMRTEQDIYVERGKADFVITRDKQLSDYDIDSKYYTIVKEQNFWQEGGEHKYYLYKKQE